MRKLSVVLLSIILSTVIAAQVFGQSSIQQINDNSQIDWTNSVYVATGEGVLPSATEEPNRARAYLKAKGYARMSAIANLLMAIEGTTVSYDATGKDYMADETIRQTIIGFVKNVRVTSEKTKEFQGNTIVVVEVRTPMLERNAPGALFISKLAESPVPDSAVKVVLAPDVKVASTNTDNLISTDIKPITPLPSRDGAPYTSVIIDTTGFKVDRCMSPKVRRQDGSEVWGTVKAEYDYLQEHGIVAYETSLESAKKNPRSGSNPLVIKAIGRSGGKFYSDPVITDECATLLLAENVKSGFLDKYKVIIVKDGKL